MQAHVGSSQNHNAGNLPGKGWPYCESCGGGPGAPARVNQSPLVYWCLGPVSAPPLPTIGLCVLFEGPVGQTRPELTFHL